MDAFDFTKINLDSLCNDDAEIEYDGVQIVGKIIIKESKFLEETQGIRKNKTTITSIGSEHTNHCYNCNIPLSLSLDLDQLYCKSCGIVESARGRVLTDSEPIDRFQTTSGVWTGNNKCGKTIYGDNQSNSVECQRQSVLKFLNDQSAKYKDKFNIVLINSDIISEVATIYSEISNEDGSRIINRGSIRLEIISAILFNISIIKNVPQTKKKIAMFMNLKTEDFTKGINIVRTLCAEKKTTMKFVIDDDIAIEKYINIYLETYNLLEHMESDKYQSFIVELVNYSEKNAILTSTKLSNKVAGACKILFTCIKLTYNEAKYADVVGCCKSTYNKFYNYVKKNYDEFKPIFDKYQMTFI